MCILYNLWQIFFRFFLKKSDSFGIVEILLKFGASANSRNIEDFNQTVIHETTSKGDKNMRKSFSQ